MKEVVYFKDKSCSGNQFKKLEPGGHPLGDVVQRRDDLEVHAGDRISKLPDLYPAQQVALDMIADYTGDDEAALRTFNEFVGIVQTVEEKESWEIAPKHLDAIFDNIRERAQSESSSTTAGRVPEQDAGPGVQDVGCHP